MKDKLELNLEALLKSIENNITEEDRFNFFGRKLDSVVEEFFTAYFDIKEGFPMSVDKAHFTIAKLRKAIEQKKHLSLQQTYREYQEAGGDIGNIKDLDCICYWCPKSLKTTEDAMKIFNKFYFKIQHVTNEIINEIYREENKDEY